MVSIQPKNCGCLSKNNFNEHGWVMQIRRIIDEEIEDDGNSNIHVSIFDVPKTLKDINPNAYTPTLVALGPYHQWRPEIQEMERFKLASAKRFQNQSIMLEDIVHRLMMLEHKIRVCYHRYLDINGETLAWMIVIDASFLLEIGEVYNNKERTSLCSIPSKMSHLVHWARRKSSHNAILRDIIMLENQIPLFVLREMLNFRFHSLDMVKKTLNLILVGLCKDLSPFKISNWEKIQPYECDHILDFLYQIMVPKVEEIVEINENFDQEIKEERKSCNLLSQLKAFLGQIPLKVILKLPWIFICNLPGITILMSLFSATENNHQLHCNDPQLIQDNKPPLVDEIMIPSVIELSKSGIIFLPTSGDIMSISFDKKSKQFYMPIISIDVNTEILLRNLVAYEASISLSSLVLARYIELMNGIIDTKEDVKLLRERGIILNYMRSDEEVANLWNGMSKSLKLTRVPLLDEIIENVNSYYERNWKTILFKIMATYVINSWKILALIVPLILFLSMFQVFYSIMVGRQPRG